MQDPLNTPSHVTLTREQFATQMRHMHGDTLLRRLGMPSSSGQGHEDANNPARHMISDLLHGLTSTTVLAQHGSETRIAYIENAVGNHIIIVGEHGVTVGQAQHITPRKWMLDVVSTMAETHHSGVAYAVRYQRVEDVVRGAILGWNGQSRSAYYTSGERITLSPKKMKPVTKRQFAYVWDVLFGRQDRPLAHG